MSDTYKKPWEEEGSIWKSESEFMSWVRSGFRKGIWNRHPIKTSFVKKYRIKVPNPNPDRRVETCWGMECAECRGHFPTNLTPKAKEKIFKLTGEKPITIEINHKNAAGSLKTQKDVGNFCGKLAWISHEDLEPLCKKCHAIYSYAERYNLTIDQARIEKEVIAICKGDEKQWLIKHGVEPGKNAKVRKQQVREVLNDDN